MKFIKMLSIAVLCFFAQTTPGQHFYDNYLSLPQPDSVMPKALSLQLYNNNFVKNNEYFGKYTEGITYIGSVVQPEIRWKPAKDFTLTAGWYFRQFYGYDGFQKSLPVIKMQFDIDRFTHLVIGQIGNRLQHGFVEPVYSPDHYFFKNPEYGVQLLVDRKQVRADLFMDWEHFLMPGTNDQEIITGGFSGGVHFCRKNPSKGLTLNAQALIHHFGGQVDESDAPLQSRANLVGGLEYNILTGCNALSKISLSSTYMQALELSQTNTIPIESGFAHMQTISLHNLWFTLSSGWFHGDNFFAPMGDYLFQSISQFDNTLIRQKRDLVMSKFLFNYTISSGIELGVRFESYYDLNEKRQDFSYGLNLRLDRSLWTRDL